MKSSLAILLFQLPFDWRPPVRFIVSVVVIGAITAGMTEGIFELMLRYPSHLPRSMLEILREYYYAEDQPSIQYLPDCSKYDDELTYTLRSGSCRFISREFDTVVTANSLGVRDDENSLRSPQIIVLGDSIALGWGVNNEDTFAHKIEKGIGKTVLNLAVSSYGTVREFKIAERVDITRLETIIVQYSSNDFDENQKFFELGNTLPISSEKHYETSQREHLKQVRYYVGKHAIWILKELYHRTKRSILKKLGLVSNSVPANLSDRSEEPFYFFYSFKAGFENLVQKQQLKPGSIMVLLLGLPWSAELSQQLLARLGRPEAVAAFLIVDLPRGRDSFYPLDIHLTAKGHSEIANRIIKVVRDRCYLNQKANEDRNMHCGSFITIL
jgi:lysophospholipase L1-like esterase